MVEGTKKHKLYHCPEWHDIRRVISVPFRKWEQKGEKVERAEVAKRYRVANDGSLPAKTGKWRACGGAVVQLDGALAWDVRLSQGPRHHQEGGADGLLLELIQGTTFRANVGRTDGSRSDAVEFNSHFNLSSGESRMGRPSGPGFDASPTRAPRSPYRDCLTPDSHQSVWPRCTFSWPLRHRPKLTSDFACPWAHTEMSRVVGIEKPQEAQKAKTLWDMKAAKDAGEDNTLGRHQTRLALCVAC